MFSMWIFLWNGSSIVLWRKVAKMLVDLS